VVADILLCAQAVKRNFTEVNEGNEERQHVRSFTVLAGVTPLDGLRTPGIAVESSNVPSNFRTAFAIKIHHFFAEKLIRVFNGANRKYQREIGIAVLQ
jgi:hypothetical protein